MQLFLSEEKMKMNKFFKILILLLTISLVSCSKDYGNVPSKGEITLVADQSFENVSEALADRYMAFYPETKIKVKFQKESDAFNDLLNNKAKLIIMSRELTDKEKKLYTSMVDLPFEPAKFAGDAVVFVTSKNSERNTLSLQEIKSELLSDQRKIIFDGAYTSNFNFVTQKLNLKPTEIKFSVLKSNENIIDQITKYPSSIGVISYNSISNPYSKEAMALRDKIKILTIKDNKGIVREANLESIRNLDYPFTRILYFLTNEGNFGIANGFIRFSCTQIGQIVVSKEGLQPYNIFKREVQMK